MIEICERWLTRGPGDNEGGTPAEAEEIRFRHEISHHIGQAEPEVNADLKSMQLVLTTDIST